MDQKQLCLSLIKSETENEVISVLKEAGYWDDDRPWHYYGDDDNNFSDIGNQQSNAESAFVEKIINSVDAVLMRECQRKQIDPEGKFAPKTLEKALHTFFGIYKGRLSNINPGLRRSLAENIGIIATGSKSDPCYVIFDKGEGQTPYRMPVTFLSLHQSNKLRIPFVQGRFNKGSTGTLQFCGENNLQLILSKRDPDISKFEEDDPTRDLWGFTIIRRVEPEEGSKSSSFKYLAPGGNIPTFRADELNILPGEYPSAYQQPLKYGSFIKLYEYRLRKRYRTILTLDMNYRLSLMLPSIALPVTLYERRQGYEGHTLHAILNGLSVRLEEDKRSNLESGFPSSDRITVQGQDMDILIFVFRKGQSQNYAPQEGVVFTINGQSHGFLPRTLFIRKKIGLDYIKDDLLVLVDCTDLKTRTKEDVFMVSRDRLRDNDMKIEITKTIEELLRTHPGLKELNMRRYQEERIFKIKEAQPIVNIINKIINKHPSLIKLLLEGQRIHSPNFIPSGYQKHFHGKRYPTYFRLKKEFPLSQPKSCHINKKFRLFFETDVGNDYFDKNRGDDMGEFTLKIGGKKALQHSINLWNGIATLTVELPSIARVGDIFSYEAIINDINQKDPINNKFYIKAITPAAKHSSENGRRILPAGGKGDERILPMKFNPPEIIPCRKSDGENYKFKMDEYGALIVMNNPSGGYNFYVNLDNPYLLAEIKESKDEKTSVIETQFSNGMAIIGLSLLNNLIISKDESISLLDRISLICKALSPFLIPLITSLNEISLDEGTLPIQESAIHLN